ncbi:MAG: endonuclease/exonuclease/phosphatase family protein [Wenzhouxiangellaceae bacterium]
MPRDDDKPPAAAANQAQQLKLLSYNIQAATTTRRYHEYVTHSWRQVLPHSGRMNNLDAIAGALADYHVVGLQEADAGSLRSGFLNQTGYLALHAGFRYWHHQSNRRVGRFAHVGNSILSRYTPDAVEEYRLPGAIPGRGVLLTRYPLSQGYLVVAVAHLALGRRARDQQLAFLQELLSDEPHVVLMGDFNVTLDNPQIERFLGQTQLRPSLVDEPTFPSWRPQRAIDFIMISPSLRTVSSSVLDLPHSDHLPVATTIALPAPLCYPEQRQGVESDQS